MTINFTTRFYYLGSVVSSPARVQFVDTEDVTARQDTGNLAIAFDEQLPQGGRQDIFIEDVCDF